MRKAIYIGVFFIAFCISVFSFAQDNAGKESSIEMNKITIIISCLALFVAIWQVITSRTHNRNAVRPFLSIDTNVRIMDKLLNISLTNKGNGPAIIKKMKLNILDETLEGDSAYSNWTKLSDRIQKEFNVACHLHLAIASPKHVLSANEVMDMLTITVTDNIDAGKVNGIFQKVLDKTKYDITYKSLYDKTYSLKFTEKF